MTEKPNKLSHLIRPKHHRAEIVFALVSFAVAILLALQWSDQTAWFDNQPAARQPGLWPLIAIVGMLVFGFGELIACIVRNLRHGEGSAWQETLQWAKAGEFLLWFLAYVWLVPWTGYLLATLLFCTSLAFRLGYRGKALFWAALVGIGIVILFKGVLSVRIPGGAFYELFPQGLRNFLVLYL